MFKLFTDGGARGNPGPAAIGAVLYKKEEVIAEISEYIGETTNNQAEYLALIAGLQEALIQQVDNVVCFLDSELIVKQLNGEYKVKNEELKIRYAKVVELAERFSSIEFKHVKRAQNKEADALVNKALDNELK